MIIDQQNEVTGSSQKKQKIDGVVIGLFIAINNTGQPLVAFPGNTKELAIPATTTVQLKNDDLGKEVALLFQGGDPRRPLIIGRIQQPSHENDNQSEKPILANIDGERIVLSAQKEILLECGKASITLTRAGKILIRGTYLSSRSTGVNRIKGGSVQLN